MVNTPQSNRQNSITWYVYIVRCKDNSCYTGITTDIQRRLIEHNSPGNGAKYTRARQPVTLIYHEQVASRSAAAKREYQIKKMTHSAKEDLANSNKTSKQ
jgi:putative endonuclease